MTGARCDPAEPRNRRTRSALLVDSGEERLLVDCGPDMREQLLAAGGGPVDRVIVTHDHADHCHGIDDLRQVSHQLGGPVPLHARADTLKRLETRFAYAFKGIPLYPAVIEPLAIDGDMTVRRRDPALHRPAPRRDHLARHPHRSWGAGPQVTRLISTT